MTRRSSNWMGCFLIGATGEGITRTGEALLGGVSDDPYDVRTFVRFVNPPGSQAHVGTELISVSEHTLLERGYLADARETTRGVNQAGLAFTCAAVFEVDGVDAKEGQSQARPFAEVTHDLMTRCDTVDDAVALFESKGRTDPPVAVLLADAKGDLAHVEIGSFGVGVHQRFSRETPGMVFAVNCYLSRELVGKNASNAVLEDERNNNLARRRRGRQLADEARGALDVPAIARILSDHANDERDPLDNPLLPGWGYSICNHGTRRAHDYTMEDLPWGTVSAEILDPSAGTLWYAYGWPCGRPREYDDQLYQDRSWGKFLPFSLRDFQREKAEEWIELTKPTGELIRDAGGKPIR
ncbi:MAG: hypothetical protein AAF436_08615 [Myxococcota bacterium]